MRWYLNGMIAAKSKVKRSPSHISDLKRLGQVSQKTMIHIQLAFFLRGDVVLRDKGQL